MDGFIFLPTDVLSLTFLDGSWSHLLKKKLIVVGLMIIVGFSDLLWILKCNLLNCQKFQSVLVAKVPNFSYEQKQNKTTKTIKTEIYQPS